MILAIINFGRHCMLRLLLLLLYRNHGGSGAGAQTSPAHADGAWQRRVELELLTGTQVIFLVFNHETAQTGTPGSVLRLRPLWHCFFNLEFVS